MNKELANSLIRRNGNVFGNIKNGFQCGNGWYDLISELAEELNKFKVRVSSLRQRDRKMYVTLYPQKIDKFEIVMKTIETYENRSINICEECGGAVEKMNLCLNCFEKE